MKSRSSSRRDSKIVDLGEDSFYIITPQPQTLSPMPGDGSQMLARFGLLLLALLTGCDRDPMVRVYEVEVRQNNTSQPKAAGNTTPRPPMMTKPTSQEPKAMVAAIVPAKDQAVFLKLTGSPDQALKYSDTVAAIAKSLAFKDGQVTFDTPEDWTRGPGSSFAMATLMPPDMDGLDGPMTVTALGKPQDAAAWPAYVQQNTDRWRGQLGLQPKPLDQQSEMELSEIASSIDPAPIYLVNYLGQGSGRPSMSSKLDLSPDVGNVNTPSPIEGEPTIEPEIKQSRAADELETELPSNPKVTFDKPEGWVAGEESSIRLVSLKTSAETSAAEASFVLAGGDDQDIVSLWARSIWADEEQAKSQVEKILERGKPVTAESGQTGNLYLVGVNAATDDGSNGNAIAGVIFEVNQMDEPVKDADQPSFQRKAFVKLAGSSAAVSENLAAYEKFVGSLKW